MFLCNSVTDVLTLLVVKISLNVKIITHKTIILIVLCGCESWTVALREEHRLMVFEKRVLRRMYGPERDEVPGGWRKLLNEELYNLYSSPHIKLLVSSNQERRDGRGVQGTWQRNAKTFWLKSLKGKGHSENTDRRKILKRILRKQGGCGLDSSGLG
jgi:hypothetical protein